MPLLLVVTLVTLSASVAQDFRWTDKVKVRRQTEADPDMEEIARTLREMTYTGEIQPATPDGIWLTTTQGTLQQYTTPSRSTPVTLGEAVTLCKNLGGRLWDKDPQQAIWYEVASTSKFYIYKSKRPSHSGKLKQEVARRRTSVM